MSKLFFSVLFILSLQITVAQVRRAAVICIYNERNEPLPETNIHLIDANKQNKIYITDFAGKVKVHAVLPIKISITRIGYETFDYTFSDTVINIKLKESKSELSGVVVTGQTEIKKLENAPQKIIIIDSKKIQQLGAVTLKDVLVNELNFRQSNDQFLGASVAIRGMGGRNIKVLIDGVPVIGRENGNIDLSQLLLANIERIEIIEGPMAVNFGGDALAGVINLITKKNASKKINGQINTLYETIGRYNIDLRLGFAYKKLSYSISGGRNYFAGWDTVQDSRLKLWKPKTQYFIENQLSIKTGKRSFLRVQLNAYDEHLSCKGPVSISPYEAYAIDQYFHTSRYNSTLNFEKKLNNGHQIELIGSAQVYSRVKSTYYKDFVTLKQVLTPTPDEQDTTKFISYMSRGTYNATNTKRKIQWQSGYDFSYDYTFGKKLLDNKQEMYNIAAFGNIEYKYNTKWLYRLGSRLTYNSKFGAPIVPALNIKYSPNEKSALRFSYARGFRAPGLKELYLYFVDQNHRVLGNPNLSSETSHNFNLDWDCKYKIKKKQASTYGSLYYNQINHMISLIATNLLINEYTYRNVDHYKNIGGTISQSVKFTDLTIKAGAGMMTAQSSFSGNLLNNISGEVNGQIFYRWAKIKTDFSIFYKYNSKQVNYILNDDGNSSSTYTISGYHWMDASIIRSFYKNHFQVTLGAKNIFNIKSVTTSGNSGGSHTGGSSSTPMGYGITGFITMKYYL